ncbi:MAG: hypothetical protein L6Q77_05075 [Bacteroidetes bacterium]|nr:hypothetical protein [Bacteroidota bacterium]
MPDQVNDENKKEQKPEINPVPATPAGQNDDFLSQLGLDIGEFAEGLGDFISDQPAAGDDRGAGVRETASGIELSIDEELDQQIDEEAKMFLADKHFRANEYYEALIPALELNIRVRQGRSKRDDVLVKRQDEILFESNYQLGKSHLASSKKVGGDMKMHHKLMALMHLYGAIDQSYQAGQETKRKEIGQNWKELIYGFRFGQYYIKSGPMSKMTVPGPEDNSSKAEFWSYLGQNEKEKLAKEMYMLMAYSYDLSYYRYQVRLANYYVETDRIREGCRYIQLPIPQIEDDGMMFLQVLQKKNQTEFDLFVNKEFTKDIKKLTGFEAEKNYKRLFDYMNEWRFRLTSMTHDAPYKNSTVRLEYLKAFQRLIEEMLRVSPTIFIDQTMNEYKSSNLTNKFPFIQEFVYAQLFYSLEMNDKAKSGMNVFDIDTEGFMALVYAVEDFFRFETSSKQGAGNPEEIKTTIRKALGRIQTSLQTKGYKLSKEPKLFY